MSCLGSCRLQLQLKGPRLALHNDHGMVTVALTSPDALITFSLINRVQIGDRLCQLILIKSVLHVLSITSISSINSHNSGLGIYETMMV